MLQNQPLEIILRIFNFLDLNTLIQCQLVSRKWSQPAQAQIYNKVSFHGAEKSRLLLRTLRSSSFIGSLVRQLEFYSVHIREIEEYRQWIQHTPNLRLFYDFGLRDAHYELILQLINQGYWEKLDSLHYPVSFCRTNTEKQLVTIHEEYYYYAVCSAKKDRLKTIAFDATAFSQPHEEIHCFRFPDCITRQTRFNQVEHLTCTSNTSMSLMDLEDILQLCPAMNMLTLSFVSLVIHANDLHNIKPNTLVTNLRLEVKEASENHFRYVFKKFPNVKRLFLIMNYHVSDATIYLSRLSLEIINLLAIYATQTDTLELQVTGISNTMDLFDSFKTATFKTGRMALSLKTSSASSSLLFIPNFKIEFQKESSSTSSLCLEHGQFPHDFGRRNATFLSTMNRFRYIGPIVPIDPTLEACKQILKYCKELYYLEIERCDFDELALPASVQSYKGIDLYECICYGGALKTLSRSFPRLTELHFAATYIKQKDDFYKPELPELELDMLKCNGNIYPVPLLLHLREGDCNDIYFYLKNYQLQEITREEFNRQMLDPKALKFDVVSRFLVALEMEFEGIFCSH
ncbi:hypothetical protein EDC96DRAFT_589506 [Choanephora cucurbitarum]|nr:hypothetical protein EDC96DRAFT_589506 [Choanephora cucurbitarum]